MLKSNPEFDAGTLNDKNLIVYPMETCKQIGRVDCGVFMLHFIDEFVRVTGTDKEQLDRAIWKIPVNVAEKRLEISNTLKEGKKCMYALLFSKFLEFYSIHI